MIQKALRFRGAFFFLLNLYMYFFRKKDPNRPTSFNLKVMHVINAIAIIMFVAGIIWKLIDWFILKKWIMVEVVVKELDKRFFITTS